MEKIIICIFLFLISFVNINAEIKSMNIYAEAEIAGGLRVKEFIVVENQKEDINLNIFLKNKSSKNYDGTFEGLALSDIYDATSVTNISVKKINNISETNLDPSNFESDDYEEVDIKTKDNTYDYQITIPNNNEEGKQIYYIDYVITNVLVEHNDCAELNYKILYNIEYDIEYINIILATPYKSNLFKVWAHGDKNVKVTIDIDKSIVRNEIKNYKKGSTLENRILFDKDLFSVNINKSKKSNLDVVDKIISIEENYLKNTKITNTLMISFGIGVIILFILISIYFIYKKVYLKK